MVNKFKIGDRVRVIYKLRDSDIGWKGTVIEDSIAPWVKMDNKPRYRSQEDYGSVPGWVVGHMDCMEQEALELVDPLEEARAAADKGINSSANHSEQDVPGWQEEAMHYLHWYCRLMARRTCNQFHIEAFRQWAASKGLKQPSELRSYGALTQRAIREKVISPTGLYARAVSSNLSPKMIYVPVDQRTVR